ncbi:hypothetical protein C357_03525 [Citreicella sp. 357]|nr:hypothetical protein C357_03525 [Citreicella sp. 357]
MPTWKMQRAAFLAASIYVQWSCIGFPLDGCLRKLLTPEFAAPALGMFRKPLTGTRLII